jgi:glyoxylase-like metal-dependent hydrolase (beta-lactamase superfamily II)
MIFEQIPVGGRKNLAYLVGDEQAGEVAAVDVGYQPDRVLRRLGELGVRLKYVLATHRHRDHVGAVPRLRRMTGAPFAAFKTVEGVDVPLDHGDEVRVGDVPVRVIHCPGHTPDSICLLVNGGKLLTGDTLFAGKVPFRSLTRAEARQLYASLRERVMVLGDEVEVWPGHEVGGKTRSTIGEERRSNPFVQQPDFEAFYRLKRG